MDMVLAIVGSSAFTGIVLKVLEYSLDRWGKAAREKRDAQAKAFADLATAVESLKEDNRVIMHDRLFCLFEELSKRDTITAGERANVDSLYERYKKNGWNHHADIYYGLISSKTVTAEEDDYE